jgi:hypothetical protein
VSASAKSENRRSAAPLRIRWASRVIKTATATVAEKAAMAATPMASIL